jgi:hypothetical protein
MPGTYYHPGAHPYTSRLPGGITVQEAYPGQYYVPHPGMSGLAVLPYNPLICALVGAIAGGGAGFGAMKVAKKKPAVAGAIGGTIVGGIVGYFLCGKKVAEEPPPPHFQPPGDMPVPTDEAYAPPPSPGSGPSQFPTFQFPTLQPTRAQPSISKTALHTQSVRLNQPGSLYDTLR